MTNNPTQDEPVEGLAEDAALAGGLFVKSCSEHQIERHAALEADCDAKDGRLITIKSERICLSRDGRIVGGTVF